MPGGVSNSPSLHSDCSYLLYKYKVKLRLSTPRRHIGRVEVQLLSLLILSLDEDALLTSGPGFFSHGSNTVTH